MWARLLNALTLWQIGTAIDLDKWGENPESSLELCRRFATQL